MARKLKFDLAGKKFGKLTAIEHITAKKQWRCMCDCGNEYFARSELLRDGTTTHCGCNHSTKLDLTGHRYGRLFIKEWSTENDKWEAQCDCGNILYVTTTALRNKKKGTKSCGCLKGEYWKTHDRPEKGKPSRNRKDYTGQVFGRLTALNFEYAKDHRTFWKYQCECGNVGVYESHSVVTRHKQSCGCLATETKIKTGKGNIKRLLEHIESQKVKTLSLVGTKFGKLTVLSTERKDFETYKTQIARCKCDCGKDGDFRLFDLTSGRTQSCGCGTNTSPQEEEIAHWLEQYVEIERQFSINGWKFDITIPSNKLIIEYNGLFWHSSARQKNNSYHKIRRIAAEKEGYNVINIWADLWDKKPERVKGLILDRLGLTDKVSIGARKLKLMEISYKDALSFHSLYHIQSGKPQASINVGCYYNETLIAVASVLKGGINTLTRLTIHKEYSVVGLLQKIMKYVGGDSWTTYCDRDYFTGKLYHNSGFICTGNTRQLSYFYGKMRYRRERFMKHKLSDLFDNVDLTLTEKEICERNNVFQIFNSGIDRWEFKRESSQQCIGSRNIKAGH